MQPEKTVVLVIGAGPVFSSGITLAVASSQLAAYLTLKHLKSEKVDWEKKYTAAMMQGVNTFRSYVLAWYDGSLQTIFFAKKNKTPKLKKLARMIELSDRLGLTNNE
jgi:hypothetical protein